MTARANFLRKRVLLEWRGLPDKEEKDRSSGIVDVLGQVIRKLGLDSRIKENEIITAWKQLVGDFLAEHSEPQQLIRGILHVRVLQPTVRYELDRVWKPDIKRKLQERFGAKVIREIKFSI
ncbi:MAG: DUF721 domain-containing protein [Chthoniobacterales bacterium]